MSPDKDAVQIEIDGDETHWWIAYAKHSAVDGAARRERCADTGAPGDPAPPSRDAPELPEPPPN